MTLSVAVQMDPLHSININGDSSFALMLAAQARGHELYHYDVGALSLDENDRLIARAVPVTVQQVAGSHYQAGEARRLDLGRDIDVVLMRQDPPFDMGYITATHLLERIEAETLVVNNPRSVRNAPEKVMVLDYRRFMPPTLVTRSVEEVREFQKRHGAIVIKPIHGNGGKAIFRVSEEGENLGALLEVFNQTWPEPHMVQAFLPEVSEGDKRIVLVDGEVAGAINRKPGEGEFRSNLAVGGYAEKTALTPEEQEICAAMGPELKRLGLIFVGIDVIGGKWLTEINVTSPTGIVAIDRFNGTDTAGMIWDAIEGRVEGWNPALALMTDWITWIVESGGYLGIALLMMLENVFSPIPSELIMGLGGIAVAHGRMDVLPLMVAGTLGSTLGNWVWFMVGRKLGYERLKPLVARYGRWLTMDWADVEAMVRFFGRYGQWVVFAVRFSPVMRTMISLPGSLARMGHARFLAFTLAGTAVWNALLVWAGWHLGRGFSQLEVYTGPVALASMVALALWYAWRMANWKTPEE